jgi:superfamily II DNA or RNA helicase
MEGLYNHQKEILDLAPSKYGLFFGTGTGKTRTSIELSKKKGGSLLIICPKMLKENWKRELDKWGFKNEYLVISKEEFKKYAPKLKRYDTIIVDEAHFFGNFQSQLSKSLDKYIKIHKPDNLYLLTASPYLSTPWNIYTLVNYLGAGLRYPTFRRMCFHEIKMGGRIVPVPKRGIEEYLNTLITSYGSSVVLEDCFDVPAQTDSIEYFELTPQQKQAIKNIDEFEFIVRFTKKHTIENGVLMGNEYEASKYFENNKIERIKSLVLENKKIAIACRYNYQIEKYKEEIESFLSKEKLPHSVYVINGATEGRQDVVDKANADENTVILINASCSEGYELPTIGTIVFASLSFSYKDYLQFRGRFLRANALKKNHYIHLVVKDGVDEDVYECIQNKKDFSFKILQN